MNFSTPDMVAIGVVIFILGMSKGGFPISGVTLPLLVILWPEPGKAARSAVAFMLPLLCLMDIIGAFMYRKNVQWKHITRLLPATIAGVGFASLLFVADKGIAVSDQALKFTIGILGLIFSAWYLTGKPRLPGSQFTGKPLFRASLFGFSAGVSSTVAHAAGPVMQMYFLPTGLSKSVFAGATVYFFLILNGIKLIPFIYYGRISTDQLISSFYFLPVIPAGVISGFICVKLMKQHHYMKFIHITLAITSFTLVIRACLQ